MPLSKALGLLGCSLKEDILEQLVEDWLVSEEGWFVKHNVKYRPSNKHVDYNSKQDSVHSDIDIMAYCPTKRGASRVAIVTCKSWQNGFKAEKWLSHLENEAEYNMPSIEFQKRERWKSFRELVSDKWLEAFLTKVKSETGQLSFTYYIAVTKLSGRNPAHYRVQLENSEVIRKRFIRHGANINFKVITLEEIIEIIKNRMQAKETPVLEATNIGRLLQLLNAAGLQ